MEHKIWNAVWNGPFWVLATIFKFTGYRLIQTVLSSDRNRNVWYRWEKISDDALKKFRVRVTRMADE